MIEGRRCSLTSLAGLDRPSMPFMKIMYAYGINVTAAPAMETLANVVTRLH